LQRRGGEGLLGRKRRGTLNIEHPTLNIEVEEDVEGVKSEKLNAL
jgi:hypothetical protein